MSVFQSIYDEEINFAISTMWDGRFDVALGDEMNGYEAEGNVDTWDEVAPWLADAVAWHYPNSCISIHPDGKRFYRDHIDRWMPL